MTDQNKDIARQVFEELQSQGKLELIEQIVARDYVGHTPLGDIHGPEGARQFDALLRTAFPDYKITVQDQVAEGECVATRWTLRGTHQGAFQGIPPTGETVSATGMTIFRIADGKLIEGWNNPGLLAIMQQLGAVPAP
jgi:steroid delta-isomerase-like uncharacterized protein